MSLPTTRVRPTRSTQKVLPEHARAHNRSLVLQGLFRGGEMSRADLARQTGLTRVTVSDLVAGLLADGLVVERGVRESQGPGKPAILLDLDRAGHCIVGLDLSDSALFRGAVLTLDGAIVTRLDAPVPARGDDVVEAVADLAQRLIAAAQAPVLGVGVGTPGVVDVDGVVLAAPGFGWRDVDLRGILQERLALPITVANDANAAVLAERTFGDADDDVMLVKVGRGVGAGVLAGGEPLRGGRSAAGEIGHVTVGTDGGPVCACGKTGCLEAWLSIPSLQARLTTHDRDTVLRDAGARLGIALAPVVGALDLSEIVLAGPVDLLGGVLADEARDTLRARTLPEFHDGVRVRMTEHGDDIVLRGAAVMVLDGSLGVF